MSEQAAQTKPKPFVFVLMPFDKAFDDIYKFGIKGAASEVGAYAERVDEQQYTEGMLERIFNQINKADVIVADMSGRNPNVFYEVGYAHALGKLVLLLTKSAEDIPFDLKHRPHTVYEGKIEALKSALVSRLGWAIEESGRRRTPAEGFRFDVTLVGHTLTDPDRGQVPHIETVPHLGSRDIHLPVSVRNVSLVTSPPLSHIYLFVPSESALTPMSRGSSSAWMTLGRSELNHVLELAIGDTKYRQYRLDETVPAMPAGAVESLPIQLRIKGPALTGEGLLRLRMQSEAGTHDFGFHFTARIDPEKLKLSEEKEKAATARSAAIFSNVVEGGGG